MWFQIVVLGGLVFAIVYLVETRKAVDKLQARLERLHDALLEERGHG